MQMENDPAKKANKAKDSLFESELLQDLQEESDRIKDLLSGLETLPKIVMIIHYYLGMTIEETAAMLKISTASVSRIAKQSIEQLRKKGRPSPLRRPPL